MQSGENSREANGQKKRKQRYLQNLHDSGPNILLNVFQSFQEEYLFCGDLALLQSFLQMLAQMFSNDLVQCP